jgi:hypothetical protein
MSAVALLIASMLLIYVGVTGRAEAVWTALRSPRAGKQR